jgi:hypothetical protein
MFPSSVDNESISQVLGQTRIAKRHISRINSSREIPGIQEGDTMTDKAIKGKCWLKSVTLQSIRDYLPLKDYFKRVDECHAELQREIDLMKTTIDGDEYWMTHKEK